MSVSIADIQNRVCARFGTRLSEMLSDRRTAMIVRPRQIAMYLAKELTPRSLPTIGRMFGRDHTTVIHAVHQIEKLRATDPGLDDHVRCLLAELAPAREAEEAGQIGLFEGVE